MRTALPLAAVLLAAALPGPSAAQSFEDRWSLIPKAQAAPAPQAPVTEATPPAAETTAPAEPPVLAQPASPETDGPKIYNQARPAAPKRVLTGRASFYAYKGGRTASGATFDRNAFTAAHRTLPFGTRLRVTDPKTRKSVQVVVTDRGPATRDRILDLSQAAAQALGIAQRGVAQVWAEVLPARSRGS